MRRAYILKNPIAFVGAVACVCCFIVMMISVLRLPEVSLRNKVTETYRAIKTRKAFNEERVGLFGEMMLEMLPSDLAFTVFVPSEKAFRRDLRLRVNQSLVAEKKDDTLAILSRILAFSGIPRGLTSAMVSSNKEVSYDSLSGFVLYVSKDVEGMLVVNGIRSERVDVRKGKIVVHIMDGVIMDAEFELAVQPDDNEEE